MTNVLHMQRCQTADGAKGHQAKYSNICIISENINV